MNIIALTGNYGSGKNTCAGYIAEELGTEIYSFADPVKSYIETVFKMPYEEFKASKFSDKLSGRDIVIAIAEFPKIGDKFYFAELMCNKLECDQNDWAVISDLRFFPEHEMLETMFKGQGDPVIVVEVETNNCGVIEGRDYLFPDKVICNVGSLKHLKAACKSLCKELRSELKL